MAEQLAALHPSARITASDLDDRMVAAAAALLDGLPNVRAVTKADVTTLPFEAGCFDVVASFLMLHHVIDWEAAIAEASRVLRPGGSLVGYDLLDTVVTRWVHRIDRSPFRLMRRDELVPVFERAGFEDVRTDVSLARSVVRFRARKPADARA